jgi:hypothetical protein
VLPESLRIIGSFGSFQKNVFINPGEDQASGAHLHELQI